MYVKPGQGHGPFHRIVRSEISDFGFEIPRLSDFEIPDFRIPDYPFPIPKKEKGVA